MHRLVLTQWEIRKLGIEPPNVWTINRILKRNGLICKKRRYESKGKNYPEVVKASEINTLWQVDLVGPRYIKGDGRFYSFHAKGRSFGQCDRYL